MGTKVFMVWWTDNIEYDRMESLWKTREGAEKEIKRLWGEQGVSGNNRFSEYTVIEETVHE